MSELFVRVLNMSICAGWLVLAVLLLRLVLRKSPKWIVVLLWGFVAIRLICPFSFESAVSLIPSAETVSPQILTEAPSITTGIPAINSTVNPVIQDSTVTVSPEKSINILHLAVLVFSKVWVAGFAAMLIYTTVSYIALRRRVSTAVRLQDRIFQSENVDSPFVLGILRPRIYIPFQIDPQDLQYVIAHETAHIRRKDHWWKPFGFVLLALHWFNPLVWLGYVLLCRDIELACDEKVIKEMDSHTKADYTQALVACSVNRRSIAACPLAFGEVGVKARVKSVMNYRKPAFWIIAAALLICMVVAVCFLTNPVSHTLQTIDNYSLTIVNETTPVFVLKDQCYIYAGSLEKAQIQEFLDLRISRKEISQDRSEDRDKTHSLMLHTLDEDTPIYTSYLPGICYHFNEDFTQVWANNDVKPTFTYKVKNPQKAREIYLRFSSNALKDPFNEPHPPTVTGTMTIEDVVALSSMPTEPTWEDYQKFSGLDIGSGLFVMRYDIDDDFYLLVGDGKLTGTPMYATLHCAYNDDCIDLYGSDVEGFISKYATAETTDPAPIEMIHGNLKTYYKNDDGTWQINGRTYRYRLVITGRIPQAVVDTTYVYLSNLENISFERAWRAAGLSSSLTDYFTVEEAVLVEWINETDNNVSVPDLQFTEYLDKINFIPGLSQGDFITQVSQYRYDNASVIDLNGSVNYDGPTGGGWQCTTEAFGFYNDYHEDTENMVAIYSNRMVTSVPLEGFELPYALAFSDSLEDVFNKIGIGMDPIDDFVPDLNTDTGMTLYRDEGSSLVFYHLWLTKEPVDYLLPYVLSYTEHYELPDATMVERTVKLSFDGTDQKHLGQIEISISETSCLE